MLVIIAIFDIAENCTEKGADTVLMMSALVAETSKTLDAAAHIVFIRHPEVLWAQRSDKVYLTVSLPDAKDVSGCKTKTSSRNILCSIQKGQRGWWKRLLKSEEKPAPYLKVDWNRWCDEDEESDCKFS
ncbi:hypothetical protein TSUD_146520 [Trifolium subterraneum]|uniref:Co-chaperone protein p23 n=1 Tax=Trifolium subterraneum TaxID=3900 RepID=A0A2Z6M8U6_TRISU|nr:hypothetical protein TSUD_146520 [Trifolium subterraneum]